MDSFDTLKINLTQSEIDAFKLKHGRKGAQTLDYALKHKQFYEDLQTKGGMYLVKDLMELMEKLLQKNVNNLLNEQERAEYKAYRDLFLRWERQYDTFRNASKKIKENKIK